VDSESEQQETELWRRRLQQVVGDHGGPSMVARLADIPLQTLKNHLSGRTKKAPLENLKQIAAACDVSFTWLAAVVDPAPADEVVRSHLEPDDEAELVAFGHSLKLRRAEHYWRVTTRALDLEHILPDDLVEFDEDRKPRRGDIVMAEIDDGSGKPRRVLRLFEPPFLVTRSSDRAAERTPVEVDGKRVRIVGVFWQLRRIRGRSD
jgi:hypothetical protein